jgi:hypothetical protein
MPSGDTHGRLTTETQRRGGGPLCPRRLGSSDGSIRAIDPMPSGAGRRTAGRGSADPREGPLAKFLWNNPMRLAYAPRAGSMVRLPLPLSTQRRSGGLPTDTRCQRPAPPQQTETAFEHLMNYLRGVKTERKMEPWQSLDPISWARPPSPKRPAPIRRDRAAMSTSRRRSRQWGPQHDRPCRDGVESETLTT